MQVTRALALGGLAHRELGCSNFTARVIGTGSRATYLESCTGEILWLSPPGSVLHRRCVVVPLNSGSWKEGDVCHSDGDTLCGDRSDAVCWSGADVWEAPPPGEALPAGTPSVTPEESAAALAGGLSTLSLRHPPRGLAELAFGVAAGERRWGRTEMGLMEGWSARASGRVRDVVRAMRARDAAGLLLAGSALVGLGEGLTPSGDDFLGGLLFGLRQQECANFDEAWIDWNMVRDWVAGASMLTNRISHAILSDLAVGYGPEPLHALARETLSGGSREVVAGHAARVIRIGNTSGWDLLAGFSVALVNGAASMPCLEVATSGVHRSVAEFPRVDRTRIPAGGFYGNGS